MKRKAFTSTSSTWYRKFVHGRSDLRKLEVISEKARVISKRVSVMSFPEGAPERYHDFWEDQLD